jgi:DNA-directed RNA polymerase beta subunit
MSKSAVRRIRKSFGKITEVAPIPNLIEVQKKSWGEEKSGFRKRL